MRQVSFTRWVLIPRKVGWLKVGPVERDRTGFASMIAWGFCCDSLPLPGASICKPWPLIRAGFLQGLNWSDHLAVSVLFRFEPGELGIGTVQVQTAFEDFEAINLRQCAMKPSFQLHIRASLHGAGQIAET